MVWIRKAFVDEYVPQSARQDKPVRALCPPVSQRRRLLWLNLEVRCCLGAHARQMLRSSSQSRTNIEAGQAQFRIATSIAGLERLRAVGGDEKVPCERCGVEPQSRAQHSE